MFSLPSFAFQRYEFLYLLTLLPLFWLLQWRAFRSLFSFLSLLLHTVVLALLVLAAAGLHTLKPGVSTAPLLAVDLSQSLTAAQRQWMHDTIVHTLRPVADTPTVVFAGQHRLTTWSEAEAMLTTPPAELQLNATNLEGAFTPLLASMRSRSVYLFSDGWETQADARSLTSLLAEKALTVYPFSPPPPVAAPNVMMQRLSAPQAGAGGEAIPISVALDNTNPDSVLGELTVYRDDK